MFKFIREMERIEYSDPPKEWVNQQDRILEDVGEQDEQINQLPDLVKPLPPCMPLTYKIQNYQSSSSCCRFNQQPINIDSSFSSEQPSNKLLSSTVVYPPNYVPPLTLHWP